MADKELDDVDAENPTWNHVGGIRYGFAGGHPVGPGAVLEITAMDKDPSAPFMDEDAADDDLGNCVLPVERFLSAEGFEGTLPLKRGKN